MYKFEPLYNGNHAIFQIRLIKHSIFLFLCVVSQLQSNQVNQLCFKLTRLKLTWFNYIYDIMYCTVHTTFETDIRYCFVTRCYNIFCLTYSFLLKMFHLSFICVLSTPVVLLICSYKMFLSFSHQNQHINVFHQFGILSLKTGLFRHHPQRPQVPNFFQANQVIQSFGELRTLTYTFSTIAIFVVHLICFQQQFRF